LVVLFLAVVFFAELLLFLAAAFLAMARYLLSWSTNLKVAKNGVNVFFQLRLLF
jgi:hypothetical protein